MIKTLRISFSLKNTYRVNGILYALKQIPLLKKVLPQSLYRIWGFKIFANVLSGIWEVISIFLGKFLYFLLMIVLIGGLYETNQSGTLFLHILVCLTLLGSFINTYMFDPSKDKIYAIIILNMNAKEYTLVNYFYNIFKILLGFGLFGILFGLEAGLPLYLCLLIPFFVAGIKMTLATLALWRYDRTGDAANENILGKFQWIGILVLLAAAYGLPALNIMLPQGACLGIMLVCILCGLLSLRKILEFVPYREVYRALLFETMTMQANAKEIMKEQNHKSISTDITIQSQRAGFEYLNELFIKRHRKILWESSKKITFVCLGILAVLLAGFYFMPDLKEGINGMLMNSLPLSLFVMYAINRGTGFTRALFINCDHSLLTYSFYKQPKHILKLFQIRLREIIKINLLPATVIGCGLALLLFASGGTDNSVNYAVLIVSIICLSIFFSVHYLTIYYLLQPYNAGTEIKSGMYQIIMWLTYMVCYVMMQINLPTLYFGLSTIVFCILYCIIASLLVYKLAHKTFKIRT